MQKNLYFARKNIWKHLVCINTFALPSFFCFFFTWQVIRNAVTPTPIQIFIGFVDAILRSKILDNKPCILTQILVIMDYFFHLYISNLPSIQGKNIWGIKFGAINLIIKRIKKGTEVLAKPLFSFSMIVCNLKFLVMLFIRKSISQGKLFGSLHTSNRMQLLPNCFSNYLSLNDMYMSLKEIGNILFVSVLRILLICKTLKVTVVFTKKINVSKVCLQFSV